MHRSLLALFVLAACGGPAAQPTTPATPPPAAETAQPAQVGPWGEAVESPEQAVAATTFLAAVADGRGAAATGQVLVIGPGLWKLMKDDPAYADRGIFVLSRVQVGEHLYTLAGRAFRPEDMDTVMVATTMVELAEHFGAGVIRAATTLERQVIYTGISWEIAGKPLTVAQAKGGTLALHFDDEGHVVMIDLVEPMFALLKGDPRGFELQ